MPDSPGPADEAAFLRGLCDAIPNGAVYHAAGRPGEPLRFDYVSTGVERMLGLTPAQVIADPMALFAGIVDEDRPRVLAALNEAARTGTPYDCTYRHRAANGDVRWLQCRSYPSPQPDGSVSWGGLVLDVTETVRLEQALAASEERFRTFMDHGPAVAWIKDADGRYAYMSRQYETQIGLRVADGLGKTDFELWPEPLARQFRASDLVALGENRSFEAVEEIEAWPAAGGRAVRWWVFKFPFAAAGGGRYVGGMALDITERERTEAELRRKNEELEAALAQVKRLEKSLVTMCAWTRTVRYGDRWVSVEQYLREQFGVEVTHGISDAALRLMERDLPPDAAGLGGSGTDAPG